MLKTAGGYLLVLHTFEEGEGSSEQCVRLLQKAKEDGDWDLCKELARFLMALDESGNELRRAVEKMDLDGSSSSSSVEDKSHAGEGTRLKTPKPHDKNIHHDQNNREATEGSIAREGNVLGNNKPQGNIVGLGIEEGSLEGSDGERKSNHFSRRGS